MQKESTVKYFVIVFLLAAILVTPSIFQNGQQFLAHATSGGYYFINSFGSYGSALGQFDRPFSASFNSTGYVYVADTFNNRIEVFDKNGNFVNAWGSAGSGNGQFNDVYGVAVNSTNYVYTVGYDNRVQIFDKDGNFVGKFGSTGSGNGQFTNPTGISINSTGFVYVADSGNNRIEVFNDNGVFEKAWGSAGSGNGQFGNFDPTSLSIDSNGNVYAADSNNNRVEKFDENGNFILTFGSSGSGQGQFGGNGGSSPDGVSVDSSGNAYAVDDVNARVEKFDSNGNFITQFGTYGSGPGQFIDLRGIAVNATGFPYVEDWGNARIQIWNLDSTPPSVSITSPASGATVTGTSVTVSGTASDDSSVTSIAWHVDSGSTTTISTSGKNINWSFTTGTLSSSTHTIYVTATDAVGLATTTSESISVNFNPDTSLTMSANATTVIQGQGINFTYYEKNTGNAPITNPSVSDDSCSPVTSHLNGAGFNEGDSNENNILDPGETWVFQCIEKQTTSGTFTHTSTGTGTDPLGNTITAPAYPSEQSSLTVTVNPATPNTVLTMSANATTVAPGQTINFTYYEKNTGNVPLTKPSVSDNSCSLVAYHLNGVGVNEGDTNYNVILDPGETWVFQCIEKQTTSGTFTHTATGTGTDPLGNTITAPAYPSEQTSLSVTVSGSPNTILFGFTNATNNPSKETVVGQRINFTYFEENTGNVPLTSPNVIDSSCLTQQILKAGYDEGDSNHNNMLDPGETWAFDCVQQQNSSGTFTHTATGHGIDPVGNDITAPAYPSEQTTLTGNVNTATTVTYQSATTGGLVGFATSAGQISNFNVVPQWQLSTPPPAGSYPFGFFTWTITGLLPGGSTTISITYPSDPGTVYEKLIAGTWDAITPASKTTNPDGSVTITLTLTDGAAGQDADQAANGQITDPGGMVVVTQAKVTGGGSVGKGINFGLEANSLEDDKTKGEVEYHDKGAKIDLHSTAITFVSADPTFTHATLQGNAKVGGKSGFSFLASVTDPDKTGDHDQLSIVITDSIGKTVYQNSGTIKGHVEIHKIGVSDKDNDFQKKNSK